MSQINEPHPASANSEAYQHCPSCQTQMPGTMRFCRSCGYRLGEGTAEYTETRRFTTPPVATAAATNALPPAMTQQPSFAPPVAAWQPRQSKHKMHWMVWVIVGVVASSIFGGTFLGRHSFKPGLTINSKSNAPRSYMGADNLATADNNTGVFLGVITPPGSAADKAGLIGGDVITAFDGQRVTGKDQLIKILTATPIGKTVEVVYLRDGVEQKAQMTTVSEEENERLDGAFDDQQHGFLGVDDLDRVPVAGTNLYGVRVGDVVENRPAYIAGLKENDIIVEFNGTPIRTAKELGLRIDRAAPLSDAKIVLLRGPENGPLERITMTVKVGKD